MIAQVRHRLPFALRYESFEARPAGVFAPLPLPLTAA
jgi:hypothetical protein